MWCGGVALLKSGIPQKLFFIIKTARIISDRMEENFKSLIQVYMKSANRMSFHFVI